jgi:hypothetical protein
MDYVYVNSSFHGVRYRKNKHEAGSSYILNLSEGLFKHAYITQISPLD